MPDDTISRPFGRSLAVAIGINTYAAGIPSLRTAANDARRVADVLARHHGYESITLLDGDATRARLVALLKEELPARVGADDRVCFYFAGHGVALPADEGPNGYLLPADAARGDESTYLYMPLVHDALLSLPCRHMLIVLDSCFSGAFRWGRTRSVPTLPAVIHRERYDRFVREPAWQVITSASQDQHALDQLSSGTLGVRDGDGDHSPFAIALFEGLEGSGDIVPRTDGGDGLITATELFLYVGDRLQAAMIEANKLQTPLLWPLGKHAAGEYVFLVPGRDAVLPPAPPLTFDANPWRGLASYEQDDAAMFFGREEPTTDLQAEVETRPLVVVLGASGCGKSSLVRAGLLPRLASDSRWTVLPIVRPGTDPFESLGRSLDTLSPTPKAARVPPARAIGTWCDENPGRQLLLVIDQCEELVTIARDPGARDAVMSLLGQLLEAHPLELKIVLTLRTDFEPQLEQSALKEMWKDARFVVPPMSRSDLKAAIEQPASARVLYFDPPSLVETLLDDVVNTPGGLPLLSFALSEMYIRFVTREPTDRGLTREDYDETGGVVGALRSRADAELEALDGPHRTSMQHLMLRMVSGTTGSLAKRRVSDAERTFDDPDEQQRTEAVVRRLTDARLLVTGKEPDGEGYAEPAHDALVRGWPTLRAWIDEANAEPVVLATRQKLAAAALEWARATDPVLQRGLLWSDSSRSATLAPLVRARAPWMNACERAFATRSVRRRRNVRLISIAATLAIAALGVVSLVAGIEARRSAAEARAQQQLATEAAARAQQEEARAEAEAAHALAQKERAVRSLFSSLRLYMSAGNAGSVCTFPGCLDAPKGDGDDAAWFSIGRIPDEVENLSAPTGEESREFIVARDYGAGHVIVYAHDGLTRDDEIRGNGLDNLTFAENALRWLDGVAEPAGCPSGTTIVLWEGTFVHASQITAVRRFIDRRGWRFVVTSPESLDTDLRCASVLWYISDWYPPADFATRHVPRIEQFVQQGGGLLVGGLGWSFADQGPGGPYAADALGVPFGFKFSLNAFEASPQQPIRLLLQ